jgi:hypothetical protein
LPTTPRYVRARALAARPSQTSRHDRIDCSSASGRISLQAFLDAWAAACGSSEQAVLAVPVGKAYRIWPVQLYGPCKRKLKLLVRSPWCRPYAVRAGFASGARTLCCSRLMLPVRCR